MHAVFEDEIMFNDEIGDWNTAKVQRFDSTFR